MGVERWEGKRSESIYEIEIDSQTANQACGCQGGERARGMDWEFGFGRYKPLCLE